MNREEMLSRIEMRRGPWDVIVIGGGATGAGCALDAASRGLDVLLLEQHDFGKGTSSRSTKLVHGGVRYLARGNISLVREALKERGILLENAPHLIKKTGFVIPCYSIWQKFFYGAGLKLYSLLSGKFSFGKTRLLSREATLQKLPNLEPKGLRGGVLYFDGQFDDARLLINILTTASELGATVVNYAKVAGLIRDESGKLGGVKFEDVENGRIFEVRGRATINATGAFCDEVRKMSEPRAADLVTPSQGIHLVFSRDLLPGEDALMIPKTSDGRVLFVIPWHQHIVVGTTDTPVGRAGLEPEAMEDEIDFILETAGRYLVRKPTRSDILSIFGGIRPLVKSGRAKNTATLSRGHTIEIDAAGLITITGGKWTTYRVMAQDAVNRAIECIGSEPVPSKTEGLRIHGSAETAGSDMSVYGSDAGKIRELMNDPSLAVKLHPEFPYLAAEVVWAVREEMARTVEDVLARRTRALFLNAKAAVEAAPEVARLMAKEMDKDEAWIAGQIAEFERVAAGYHFHSSM